MDVLEQVLSRVRRRDPTAVASIAGVAALVVVLKWASSSSSKPKVQGKFVTDFAEIAGKDGEEKGEKFDVVIVGGGEWMSFSELVQTAK